MENFHEFIRTNPQVRRLSINDLLIAEYRCPLSDTRYDIWSHLNYFIYVTSGRKRWSTATEEVLVERGDCLFVRKGAHCVYQYFDDQFCALVVFVPDSLIRSVLLESRIELNEVAATDGGTSLFPINPNALLKSYFRSFLAYLAEPNPPASALVELKFKELVMIVATELGGAGIHGYFFELCRTGKPSLREIMEKNFSFPMNLQEYARLSGRSLSAFKREFKSIFDTTPARWLIHKRLEYGKYLLENTDRTVTEVVLDCGFKDASHFSRAFRETYGMTPLQASRRQQYQDPSPS